MKSAWSGGECKLIVIHPGQDSRWTSVAHHWVLRERGSRGHSPFARRPGQHGNVRRCSPIEGECRQYIPAKIGANGRRRPTIPHTSMPEWATMDLPSDDRGVPGSSRSAGWGGHSPSRHRRGPGLPILLRRRYRAALAGVVDVLGEPEACGGRPQRGG